MRLPERLKIYLVEGKGFEPSTSGVRFQRSPTELAPHGKHLPYTEQWQAVHFLL